MNTGYPTLNFGLGEEIDMLRDAVYQMCQKELTPRAADIDWRALEGARAVGITAGASAPEVLVNEVVDAFRDRFAVTTDSVVTAEETVEFKPPRILREPAA